MTSALVGMAILGPVVFEDGFESGTFQGWGDERGDFKIVSAAPFTGLRCAQFTAQVGKGTGGHLVRWFMPGYDEVWARWAVKFADDFDQGDHMHLCWMGGNRAYDKYSAFGKAGKKPDGTDFFVTNLEPWREWGKSEAPGKLMFYSYWPDMVRSRDGAFWGNNLTSGLQVPRGKWTVWTMWMKLNKPGSSDGEQAFWMDGKLGGYWRGMRFRDTENLRLNSFAMDLYVHDSKKVNVLWFDDVSVRTTPFVGMSPPGRTVSSGLSSGGS